MLESMAAFLQHNYVLSAWHRHLLVTVMNRLVAVDFLPSVRAQRRYVGVESAPPVSSLNHT